MSEPVPLRRRIPPKTAEQLASDLMEANADMSAYDATILGQQMYDHTMGEIYRLARLGEDLSAEVPALKQWQADACDELMDIRSQWGDDYLWWKHNEKPVCKLLREAGYVVNEKERP